MHFNIASDISEVMEHKQISHKRVALVGHPNVGKSVLFNALTGKYVMVSNYPGTTVELAKGVGNLYGGPVEFVDCPGIHSLIAHSDEERVTRSLLIDPPNFLIQVVDSKNLLRGLILTLELAELQIPMVLCLNMKDEALSRGYRVDAVRLSRILGIPVVETVATTREGVDILKQALERASLCHWRSEYPPEIGQAFSKVESMVPEGNRFFCSLILQNHITLQDLASFKIILNAQKAESIAEIRKKFVRPISSILMESRQAQAAQVVAEVLARPSFFHSGRMGRAIDLIGRWSLRPWPGYLIASLVLWGLYEFVGVLGAQVMVDFLEEVVFGSYLNPLLTQLIHALVPWPFMEDMLVGRYGIFTMALTYAFALIFPIVTAFFLALGILEDTGYLPRLSVLLDRFFRLMGLNGKAVFPMVLGLGCGTMAMLTARILDTKKEKMIVSFLLALAIPCSAQLGVILAMASGLSVWVMALWLGVVLSSLLGIGWAASRVLPGASVPFLMEIPPMRMPEWNNLFRKVAARLKWYLREVVPLFVWGTLALYFLDAFGWLQILERWALPVVTGFLGLPEKATEAFLIGFLRRDYGAAGFYQMQRNGLLTMRQSAVAMIAITLFMPCIAQWFMSLKERGLRVTLAISFVVTSYALIVSGVVNYLLVALHWE